MPPSRWDTFSTTGVSDCPEAPCSSCLELILQPVNRLERGARGERVGVEGGQRRAYLRGRRILRGPGHQWQQALARPVAWRRVAARGLAARLDALEVAARRGDHARRDPGELRHLQ